MGMQPAGVLQASATALYQLRFTTGSYFNMKVISAVRFWIFISRFGFGSVLD